MEYLRTQNYGSSQYAYLPQPAYAPQSPYAPQPACTPQYAPPPPVAQNPFADWECPYPSQHAYQPQPVYAPPPACAPQYDSASKPITALDLDSGPVDDTPGFKLPAAEIKPAQPAITNKQLRALSRKHLYIMIRDQERELRRARERESLLRGFHAWLPQGRQSYGV